MTKQRRLYAVYYPTSIEEDLPLGYVDSIGWWGVIVVAASTARIAKKLAWNNVFDEECAVPIANEDLRFIDLRPTLLMETDQDEGPVLLSDWCNNEKIVDLVDKKTPSLLDPRVNYRYYGLVHMHRVGNDGEWYWEEEERKSGEEK